MKNQALPLAAALMLGAAAAQAQFSLPGGSPLQPNSGFGSNSPLFGVPASGKQPSWTGIDTARVANGKIVERWLNADILGLMQQLGLGGQ